MSKLVYEAIEKHIHPTRYWQIVETESAEKLSLGEQDIISRDHKHSSHVARTYYQKISSRDVATKARQCMDKLRSQSQPAKSLTMDNKETSVLTYKQTDTKFDLRIQDIYDHELFLTQRERPKRKVAIQQDEIKSKRRHTYFTVDEDRFITAGIKKHGFGRWRAILKDPDYNFLVTRTCDSIMKRARTLVSNKTQNTT